MRGTSGDVVESDREVRTSGLGAIALLARAAARGRGTSIVVIVGVAALVSGATLTTAAGARRTATVVDRMVSEFPVPDLGVGIYLTTNAGEPERLRAAEEALAEQPGIDQAIALPNIFAAVGPGDGSWNLQLTTPLDGRFLESRWTGPMRDGRLPAVDGRGEVAIDAPTASRLGLAVGDELVAPTISVETTDALIRGLATELDPDGPELRFIVVGIFRESVTDDPTSGYALTSPDTARYLGQAGASDAYFLIEGDAEVDVAAAMAVVSETMDTRPSSVFYADPDIGLDPVRDTVEITAAGLALFALISAAAGLIALGQVVGRQVADSGRLATVTSALGMRDRATVLAVGLPSTVAAAVGIVIGAFVAAGLSSFFPTGQGRWAEPDPGIRLDWPVLTIGPLVLVVVMSGWAFVSARRRVRPRDGAVGTTVRRRRSVLRRGVPVSAAIGSSSVLVPNRIRAGVRPVSALTGTVLGVAGVMAITVFTASQQTTADDPVRYGWNWDVDVELTVDDPEALVTALAAEPALAAVGVVRCGSSRIDGEGEISAAVGRPDRTDSQLCGLEVLSGSMPLTYLDGRAPSSPGELAVGQTTARRLDLEIGDVVEVTGATGEMRSLEIAGVAVIPDQSDPSSGLIAMPDTARALVGDDGFTIAMLTYAPGVTPDEVRQVLADEHGISPDELTNPSPPPLLERLDLVRPTLVALAVFLGALGAIGLLHFLLLSTIRRQQESTVLRALGFVRAQTTAVVVWQAVTIASIGLLIGTPLGVVIGRSTWVASIDHLGIVDDPTVPWRFVAILLISVLGGAGLVGLVTGWRASRARPVGLHEE